MLNAAQIRAARGLVNWTQPELAKQSGLALGTIQRMEKIGTGRSSVANVEAVQRALEAAGVAFIPENGGGAGVRLARPGREDEGKRPDELNATNDD
ncbi:transcriptional regulator [Mesorhizobium sp. L-8-3]|nr:helix-turn-helix transcriptional regulator [Mesorhizobium sp. L-8-3]BCH22096.1 transcriptional regulator [Mesorhizobium sp. L-8-3]